MDNLFDNEFKKQPSKVRWYIGVICLAIATLFSGSPNLYPTFFDDMKSTLKISDGVTTLMLTGGVMLMYFTLPAGLFMDKYGATLTIFISAGITIVGYIVLIFWTKSSTAFIIFFLFMAFGSSTFFIAALQIVLAKSSYSNRGVSASIVSGSLSLSFGLCMQIYSHIRIGKEPSNDPCNIFWGTRSVGIFVIGFFALFLPIGYFLTRPFHQESIELASKETSNTHRNKVILTSFPLYILIITNFITVFDGMFVLSGGSTIWTYYGYGNGAEKYSICFSVTNCSCSILLSMLLDYLIVHFKITRARGFSIFWLIFGIIPILVGIVFTTSKSHIGLAIVLSMLGIPFGFGLTHLPALTSEIYGADKYGFAYGIVQIGAIAASTSALPIIRSLSKRALTIVFFVFTGFHIFISIIFFFFMKNKEVITTEVIKDSPLLTT